MLAGKPDLARAMSKRTSWNGAHGWNIDIDAAGTMQALVQLFGVRNVAWVGVVAYARCWVLRDRNILIFGSGWTEPLDPFLVSLWWIVGEGTARTLRTTQWTRAS